jgi:hypothetical protein
MEDAADEPPLTERERIETDLIRSLISSYFHIVRESIQDLVPKAIMHLLVNHCKEVLFLVSLSNTLGFANATCCGFI